MINYEKHDQQKKIESEHTLVAVFASRAEARSAIADLHKAKYTHTWLGTTSIAETAGGVEALTVETHGFFAGSQSLVDALVSHGVPGDTARTLEGRIEPGNALLTLNPKDKDSAPAVDIIEKNGGRVAGGSASSDDWSAWPVSEAGSADADLDDVEFEEFIFARRR